MLVVKIEVWPQGDGTRAKEIGRAEIVNTSCPAEGDFADYLFTVAVAQDPIRIGRLYQHPRSRGVLWLLLRVLRAALDLPDED